MTEMSEFLRARRERLTPAEAGLPSTGRRRTPGLRREEVALLAGISATWYTYLEQGRDVRASEQVLGALARALRLDGHERDHLFRLAGQATPAEPGRADVPDGVAGVPLLLEPNPAYLIDGLYDVVSLNPAAAALFPGLTAGGRTANFARWTFLEPASRAVLVDWEPDARGLLARLRTLTSRHPQDPRFANLVRDLHEGCAEVREWWPRYEIQDRHGGRKRLRSPAGEVADYAYAAFHLAEQPELTLVVYSDRRA
jgi:transcriptional regulator with XRE-family HTH domain